MVLPLWIITENVDMAKWFVAAKRADFQKIGETFGISPVLARIIRNRDIVEEDDIRKYLQGTVEEMYDPGLFWAWSARWKFWKEKSGKISRSGL